MCGINSLRNAGIQEWNFDLPENQQDVAKYSLTQIFLSRFNIASNDVYINPGPNQTPINSIIRCINCYSERKGICGKLAGLVYRIVEIFKDLFCCQSDWAEARTRIVRALASRNLPDDQEFDDAAPVDPQAKADAEALLKDAITRANELLRAPQPPLV